MTRPEGDEADCTPAGPVPVTTVAVVGLRCSGTNFVRRIVDQSWSGVDTAMPWWKHAVPTFPVPAGVLLLVVVRNPYDWIQSLQRTPHHAPELVGLPLRRFLQASWRAYRGPGDLASRSVRMRLVDPNEQLEAFDDVFDLRATKLAGFLAVQARAAHHAVIRYEDVLADRSVLHDVAAREGIRVDRGRDDVAVTKFGRARYRRRDYRPLLPFERNLVRNRIDWTVEAQVGYRPDDLPTRAWGPWLAQQVGGLPHRVRQAAARPQRDRRLLAEQDAWRRDRVRSGPDPTGGGG